MGIPHYQSDIPGDGTYDRDINYLSIAHDDWYYYVRISFNQAPSFNSNDFGLWMDTDLNPNAGMRDFTGAIGSDRLVWGAAFIDDIAAWHVGGWVGWDLWNWSAGDLPHGQRCLGNRVPRGWGWDGRFFRGDIDDVAIYNYPLPAHRVYAHDYVGHHGRPEVEISGSSAGMVLTWPAGALQQADAVSGP